MLPARKEAEKAKANIRRYDFKARPGVGRGINCYPNTLSRGLDILLCIPSARKNKRPQDLPHGLYFSTTGAMCYSRGNVQAQSAAQGFQE